MTPCNGGRALNVSGSQERGWRGRIAQFNAMDALALKPGLRGKNDVATFFADLSAIRKLDHSVGCCLRNTNGTADVGHCRSPLSGLANGARKNCAGAAGECGPILHAMVSCRNGIFVCCRQAAYRTRQNRRAVNGTLSQAHFDACTCRSWALRCFASRGTPTGSRAALSHNRLRGLPNAAREPRSCLLSRNPKQRLVLAHPAARWGAPCP